VIDEFKRIGPGEQHVGDARAALMRDFETNSGRNDYLLNRIVFKYEYGEDVKEVFNMRPFYDQLTVPVLRDAARAYLNTNRLTARRTAEAAHDLSGRDRPFRPGPKGPLVPGLSPF
jgi:hypothetical protein